jgi:hypothetical protein
LLLRDNSAQNAWPPVQEGTAHTSKAVISGSKANTDSSKISIDGSGACTDGPKQRTDGPKNNVRTDQPFNAMLNGVYMLFLYILSTAF